MQKKKFILLLLNMFGISMKVDKSKALLLLRCCKPGSIDSTAQADIDKKIYTLP